MANSQTGVSKMNLNVWLDICSDRLDFNDTIDTISIDTMKIVGT